jgi:hypothetical protein
MAAGSTYTPIATTTLGSATGTVTFSSISGSYTDLILVCSVIGNGSTNLRFTVNNDSGSNYSGTYMYGNGSSAGSGRTTSQTYALAYGSGIDKGSFVLHFQNYSNTTTNKTILCRGDDASNQTNAWVDLWRSTAAINRIDLSGGGNNYSAGSTFTLYGIAAA